MYASDGIKEKMKFQTECHWKIIKMIERLIHADNNNVLETMNHRCNDHGIGLRVIHYFLHDENRTISITLDTSATFQPD